MDERTLRVLEYRKIINMLAEHTLSSMGKERTMSLHPSNDRDQVINWINETTEAESVIIGAGSVPMDEFPDIRGTLRRSSVGGILNPKELLEVSRVLRTARFVKEKIIEQQEKKEITIIPSLSSKLEPHNNLCKEILRCIESEERIYDNASSELASIRRQIRQAHEKIKERLNNIIHSPQQQKYLQEYIVTIRNERYVVPVKQECRGNIPGLIHDQSSSGATLFIEPMAVVEANNELREWMIKEEKEIERILYQLTIEVESVIDDISQNLTILTELDFIFAKGQFSLSIRGVAPIIIKEQWLKIINGRHPLIKDDEVVPISINIGKDFNTLVITGPNTGGKTVSLKTVGLFSLMAQSGLHLPAEHGTEMGIFNSIFADIGDEQSIEQNLSTFSSHMTNIVNILNKVSGGSLVLFDELGAGTDPIEGAALAMGILTFLYEQNICTIATTHYSELKVFALNQPGVENASMEFNVETLSPTYRLLIGVPGKSNAFEISRRLGLNEELIERAKNFLSQEDVRFEDLISDMEYNRRMAEEEREEAKKLQNQAEMLKKSIEEKHSKMIDKHDEIIRKAREEAKRILKQAKEESDLIIKELQQLSKETDAKERNRALEEARKKLRGKLGKLEELTGYTRRTSKTHGIPPSSLKLGETVYIINLDQKGQVLTLPDQNGEVQIQVGIMKVNSHISNLRKTKESEDKGFAPKKISIRSAAVTTELDLRGMNVEDAIISIDKYLDDVFLAGLNEVTIIHGKGTGVLRTGVHEHLRSHPHVASFRIGKYGEGEMGVTVVEIK